MKSMTWKQWAIMGDVEPHGRAFCFCPVRGDIDGEYTIVTGLMYVSNEAPGEVVAVIHDDGNAAAEAFYMQHKNLIDGL